MLQFNESIGSLMHTVCVDVTDEGLEQLEIEPGSQQSAPVWDGKTRLVIPAFPAGARPAAGHVHTPDDAWLWARLLEQGAEGLEVEPLAALSWSCVAAAAELGEQVLCMPATLHCD